MAVGGHSGEPSHPMSTYAYRCNPLGSHSLVSWASWKAGGPFPVLYVAGQMQQVVVHAGEGEEESDLAALCSRLQRVLLTNAF